MVEQWVVWPVHSDCLGRFWRSFYATACSGRTDPPPVHQRFCQRAGKLRISLFAPALPGLHLPYRCRVCRVFGSLKTGSCGWQGSKRPLVAFFGGPETGGRRRIHAWMSHSTHGLRTMMREEHGVGFALPYARGLQTAPEIGGDFQIELADLGQVGKYTPVVRI